MKWRLFFLGFNVINNKVEWWPPWSNSDYSLNPQNLVQYIILVKGPSQAGNALVCAKKKVNTMPADILTLYMTASSPIMILTMWDSHVSSLFSSLMSRDAYMCRQTVSPLLIPVMSWSQTGDKPLPEPMMEQNLLTFESKCKISFNSMRPSDAIWRQRTGSTLAQVMACCLTGPSHYLNQCWLIISKIQLHSSDGNFTRDTSVIYD